MEFALVSTFVLSLLPTVDVDLGSLCSVPLHQTVPVEKLNMMELSEYLIIGSSRCAISIECEDNFSRFTISDTYLVVFAVSLGIKIRDVLNVLQKFTSFVTALGRNKQVNRS